MRSPHEPLLRSARNCRSAAPRDLPDSGHVLGLAEIPKPELLAARGVVWFQRGAQQLHLGVEDDFRPAKKVHSAFAVVDLDALARDLEAGGYRAVVDSVRLQGSRRIFTEDPFGNRVDLAQHRSEA